jgi:hypothetical protein
MRRIKRTGREDSRGRGQKRDGKEGERTVIGFREDGGVGGLSDLLFSIKLIHLMNLSAE